jgi:hypothetical protein
MKKLIRYLALVPLTLLCSTGLQAGTYFNDFNTSPADLLIRPHSKWVESGGVGGTGFLSITDAINDQNQAGVILPNLDPGLAISGFNAQFKLRMGGGSARPADGFSFSLVPETHGVVTGGGIGEEGPGGAPLVISFDSWDNAGADTAPAIEVKVNDQAIAFQSLVGTRDGSRAPAGPLLTDAEGNPVTLSTGNEFVDVEINLEQVGCDYIVNVTYKGVPVFTDLPIPFTPTNGRFVLGARTGGANDNHWVDDLNITTTPSPLYVSRMLPNSFMNDRFLRQGVLFELTDGPGSSLDYNFRPTGEALTLTFDGNVIPADELVVTFLDPHPISNQLTTRVQWAPTALLDPSSTHTAVLAFNDANEVNCTATRVFTTTFYPAETLFIEAEDFNYTEEGVAGQHAEFGDSDASLLSKAATLGVDYQDNPGNADQPYRSNTEAEAGKLGADNPNRGSREIEANYVLGWNDAGEWFNYTRTFPEPSQRYNVYGRLASGGAAMAIGMGIVTSDPSQPGQTVVPFGEFRAPATGNWDVFTTVPMTDDLGNLVSVRLGGTTTIRATVLPGAVDMNFYAFVPAETQEQPPIVTSVSPSADTSNLPGQVVRAVISDQDTSVVPGSIKLFVNDVDVTASASIVDTATGATVEYQLTPSGSVTIYDVRVEWADDSAPAVTGEFSWSFAEGVLSRGFILREFYGNQNFTPRPADSGDQPSGGIGGGDANAWNNLVNHPTFPDSPRYSCYTNLWELWPFDAANDYGSRMSAWFIPPVDGEYTFWLAADDHTRLYLSTDADPANKVEISRVPEWTGRREYNHASIVRANQPVNLAAGQRYYMETIHKEGGGGDHVAVHVQFPGAAAPANGDMPVSGAFFEALVSAPGATIEITQHPESQTVMANRTVTFTASAVGTGAPDVCAPGGLFYQWRRNGVEIAGANSATYTTPFLTTADSGNYDVVVSVLGATGVSNPAVLTVEEDTVPPVLLSAAGGPGNRVILTFSEPIDPTTVDNFALAFSGDITATGVSWFEQGSRLVATTTEQTPGTEYTVTLTGGKDRAGLNFDPAGTSATFTALISTNGVLLREWYFGVPGTTVPLLTNHAKFPDSPDLQDFITQYHSDQTSPDLNNYGIRVTGYIIPPETGTYVFQTHSDDSSLVRLSTDHDPANLRVVAREDACCTPRNGPPVFLEAGVPYYTESVMNEGGGGDYLRVRWSTPSNPSFQFVEGANVIFYAFDPSVVNLMITQHPMDATVQQHESVTFMADASATVGFQRRWQVSRDDGATWEDLPVTGTSFTILFPTMADHHNNLYRLKASVPLMEVFSNPARLTVTEDTVAPTVRYAVGLSPTQIAVLFSEPLHPDSGDPFSFELSGGVSVGTAVLNVANPARIDITLAEGNTLTLGQTYTLTINGNELTAAVQDTSGNMLEPTVLNFQAIQFHGASPDNILALPTDRMLPTGSLTERGFQGRIIQNPGITTDNTVTELALAGLLPQPNVVDHSFIETGIINYNQDAVSIGRIPNDTALPGFAPGDHNNLAMELLTYLELEEGIYAWSVNSDDGFRVTLATSADDPNAIVLGQFNGGRGSPAEGDDVIYHFRVTESGLYPFRLIWQEGGGGANIEWWTLDTAAPTRVYVPINSGAGVPAFLPPAGTDCGELSIRLEGDEVVIEWTGPGVLQSTATIDGEWADEGVQSPHRVAATGDQRYYRLICRLDQMP